MAMVDEAAKKGTGDFHQQHRRRCPRENGRRRGVGSGTSLTRTSSGWRHRLKRWRCWRGWLEHKRRRCSLEGATTTSSSGVSTNGRATQTRSLIGKRRKLAAADKPWGTVSGAPSTAPSPLPYLLPPVNGQWEKSNGERRGRPSRTPWPGTRPPSRMQGPRSGWKDPAAGRRR